MFEKLFLSIDSKCLAHKISLAKQTVCYAGPGILEKPAEALVQLSQKIGPEMISVCLDFDEHVMRMGFGTIDAVGKLQNAGIEIRSMRGLRTGLVVIDLEGYIFTPTALYLETDTRSESAPNAMRLSEDQVKEARARLSESAKIIAVTMAKSDNEREWLARLNVDMPSEKISNEEYESIKKNLADVPPVNFDVDRQVRVYSAYIQYVELHLTGAAILRRRLTIPQSIQKLGVAEKLANRLNTTFDLLEKNEKLTSKILESNLNEIRKNFTHSLGNKGRIILKTAKPKFEDRIKDFENKLKQHQKSIIQELQIKLNESRDQIVEYYVPQVVKSPPDNMIGNHLKFGEEEAKIWLKNELKNAYFPKAEVLVKKMRLIKIYKDLTFDTLNEEDFLKEIKNVWPHINWEKAYSDFQAAGEIERPENSSLS